MAEVRAEITANVWQVRVDGSSASRGDELVVLESMKMEIPVLAPIAGVSRHQGGARHPGPRRRRHRRHRRRFRLSVSTAGSPSRLPW